MDESPSTRGSVSLVTSHNATPRANQPRESEPESMAKKKRSPRVSGDKMLEKLVIGEDVSFQDDLYEQMQEEKIRYPGASGWAPAEERLFEILFMRQDLPMLPSNWDIDFSTVPISETVFHTSEEHPPIIYAHQKEFRATLALMRLIDLTSSVRTSIQAGYRNKVPGIIKRELDKYINWAAQDGDYNHLKIVPNIMVEIVDTKLKEGEITDHIQNRMRDLARLQREFLREDMDPEFWNVVKPKIMTTPRIKMEPDDGLGTPISAIKAVPKNPADISDELAIDDSGFDGAKIKVEPGLKRQRPFPSPIGSDIDELSEDNGEYQARATKRRKILGSQPRDTPSSNRTLIVDTPKLDTPKQQTPRSNIFGSFLSWSSILSTSNPKTPVKPVYRRPPPVVYGLFILNSSVLLLTADSSRGDKAYVSFHVQTNFQDTHQSVWNALTLAVAICLARDELRERREDFESLPIEVESDPDA